MSEHFGKNCPVSAVTFWGPISLFAKITEKMPARIFIFHGRQARLILYLAILLVRGTGQEDPRKLTVIVLDFAVQHEGCVSRKQLPLARHQLNCRHFELLYNCEVLRTLNGVARWCTVFSSSYIVRVSSG